MRIEEIINKLKIMDKEVGELIPDPNIVEATGCEDINIEVLDREKASLSLTSCSEKLRNPGYFKNRKIFERQKL